MARLGLLETDTLYDELIDEYGSYGKMFAGFFDALGGQLSYRYYQVQAGEFPQHPNECDAYLITGSKAGVYDPLPWIHALQNWIVDFHRQRAPIIGICFGHQIIAHSLGGCAAKSDKGWGLGVLNCKQTLQGGESSLRLIHSHQDQVLTLPPTAVRLAGCDFCPNAALAIDNNVLTFQGHPEFSPAYLRRLLEQRKGRIDSEVIERALASLATPTDHEQVGRYLLDFIKR
ncbi:MAG: GMP synthase [Gammaproteobacteria bacterium]|nr:GMP synthase [Gammaproteobacteria bacterium]MBQ0841035.1 GMP synthase [Gammaproteobacteria bacterium]